MKYTKFLLLTNLFISFFTGNCFAQSITDVGRAHYKAALLLLESASSINDYSLVAEELEAVVQTDPDYPNTYIDLCKIYGRIGSEKGEPYFRKAEEALSRFRQLNPSDSTGYTEESIALNAMKRKYDANVILKKTGNWYLSDGNGNYVCPDRIMISANEPYQMTFSFPPQDSSPRSFNNLNLNNSTIEVSIWEGTEYGRYTIGRGSITDHDILVWHSDRSYGSYGGVTGYYDAYQYSKTAVKEQEMIYYRLVFENDKLTLYWTLTTEYIDNRNQKIFYQSCKPQKYVFFKQ